VYKHGNKLTDEMKGRNKRKKQETSSDGSHFCSDRRASGRPSLDRLLHSSSYLRRYACVIAWQFGDHKCHDSTCWCCRRHFVIQATSASQVTPCVQNVQKCCGLKVHPYTSWLSLWSKVTG